MNMESMIVWLILGVVIVLLASDRLAADGIAVAGLLALVIAGSLQPAQALAGFSSPAVIAIASLLVLSAALDYTGVVRRLVSRLYQLVVILGIRGGASLKIINAYDYVGSKQLKRLYKAIFEVRVKTLSRYGVTEMSGGLKGEVL